MLGAFLAWLAETALADGFQWLKGKVWPPKPDPVIAVTQVESAMAQADTDKESLDQIKKDLIDGKA